MSVIVHPFVTTQLNAKLPRRNAKTDFECALPPEAAARRACKLSPRSPTENEVKGRTVKSPLWRLKDMANPCLTTTPSLSDPLVINANPGTINLKVTGTVFLDPSQTDVVQTDGTKVAFTCTAQTLSFTAEAGKSYFLEIMHAGTLPTST